MKGIVVETVINEEEKVVVALAKRKYEDGQIGPVVARGIARCHGSDEFDLAYGVKLATHRALLKAAKDAQKTWKAAVDDMEVLLEMYAGEYTEATWEVERHDRIVKQLEEMKK